MDRDSKKSIEQASSIFPNWTEVSSFTKNENNKDKFFDSEIVVNLIVESASLNKTRKEIKIDDACKEHLKLITAGW